VRFILGLNSEADKSKISKEVNNPISLGMQPERQVSLRQSSRRAPRPWHISAGIAPLTKVLLSRRLPSLVRLARAFPGSSPRSLVLNTLRASSLWRFPSSGGKANPLSSAMRSRLKDITAPYALVLTPDHSCTLGSSSQPPWRVHIGPGRQIARKNSGERRMVSPSMI